MEVGDETVASSHLVGRADEQTRDPANRPAGSLALGATAEHGLELPLNGPNIAYGADQRRLGKVQARHGLQHPQAGGSHGEDPAATGAA